MDVPLEVLDQAVSAAHNAVEQAREERHKEGAAPADMRNPLEHERLVSRRDTWRALIAKPNDPIAAALADWVYALTLERVLFPDAARIAAAWHAPSIELLEPAPEKLSPFALRLRFLAERDSKRAKLWAAALAQGVQCISDAEHLAAERRAEAIRLLGADRPHAIELPCDPPEAVKVLAEALLARTGALLERPRGTRWDDVLRGMLARDADADFPARITARWLEGLFHATGLTEGLRPSLFKRPQPLGATSFARALAHFGRAFARAALPSGAPFALALRPFDLRVSRRAALFSALPADAVFLAKTLHLGRDRARNQARKIARALLLSVRAAAVRVLLQDVPRLEAKARAHAWEEQTARAFGDALPGSLAGVMPRLSPSDGCDFLGILASAADRARLIERFDEDWFRNPHAAHALREEQETLQMPARAAQGDMETALAELVRAFEQALR